MKILLLTQWFDPEPTFKGLQFAAELRSRGHEVEVLTGFPNYPGGRVYPGYRVSLREREVIDGTRITRVALYPSHDRSALRRVANYLSFALSASTIGACSVGRPDVVYVYHPPATAVLPAIVLRMLRRVPFVLDIQDLWPDTLAATGMVGSRPILRTVGAFCRLAYRLAARIVVLSPGFRKELINRGVPSEKIKVIPNWCDEAAFGLESVRESNPAEPGMKGRFNVVFAGTMGKAQALSSVLQAAKLVQEREPRVQFVFVGGGIEVESLKAEAEAMGVGNVLFLPRRPAAAVAPLLKSADVLLVHLRDDPLFAITIPSKTQAYLAVGRPILMAVRGDAAELVLDAGAGVCVEPENPAALASAVCELAQLPAAELDAMGQRGRAFYQRQLSLKVGVDRFEMVLQNAAGEASG